MRSRKEVQVARATWIGSLHASPAKKINFQGLANRRKAVQFSAPPLRSPALFHRVFSATQREAQNTLWAQTEHRGESDSHPQQLFRVCLELWDARVATAVVTVRVCRVVACTHGTQRNFVSLVGLAQLCSGCLGC